MVTFVARATNGADCGRYCSQSRNVLMDIFAIILSLVAIVMAFMALQRTGGLKGLRQQMDLMTSKTEEAAKGAREVTADALRRLEHMVRGQEGQPPDKAEKPEPPPEAGSHS